MSDGQTDFLIVSIVQNCLGNPKSQKDSESRVQWEFNCPSQKCKHDHNKYNLAYQSTKKVFKCWKCNYRGYIHKLIRDNGTREDYNRLKLILPEYEVEPFSVFKKAAVDYELVTCELPLGYLPLNYQRSSNLYKLAWDYVTKDRKITPSQIDKYKIGYTETGSRKFRIILPSFNAAGRLNYYEARSFLKDPKVPYLKPDEPDKQDIIFNEQFINWDLPIYLVEGVFDAIRIPNAIAMLGKIPSPLLISKLLRYNVTVIVCLDSDALRNGMDIYNMLYSLGLNVFFVDLKGKKDISKTYEDHGQTEIDKLLKTVCHIDTMFELNKIINE